MSSRIHIQRFNFRNEITPATKIYFKYVSFQHSIQGLSVSISPVEKCNRVFRNQSCLQIHRFPLSLAAAASLLYFRYQSLPNRNRISKNKTSLYSTETRPPHWPQEICCSNRRIHNRNSAELFSWPHLLKTCSEHLENIPNRSLFSANSPHF